VVGYLRIAAPAALAAGVACSPARRSAIVQGFRVMPAAIAGVMRKKF
jgi:hypothetical protein